jgi:hypothetical protein
MNGIQNSITDTITDDSTEFNSILCLNVLNSTAARANYRVSIRK